jgi:hypothetical protein
VTASEETILKYTGKHIHIADLNTKTDILHQQIMMAIVDITSAEGDLLHSCASMIRIAQKVNAYIEAKPHEKVRQIGPWGEVTGSDAGQMDARITTFHERVKRLQALVRLYTGPAV